MADELDVPRRGYETKDVEAMARALDATDGGDARRGTAILIFLAAIAGAIWLMVSR